MQAPLTDPITSLLLSIVIGGAVGLLGRIATGSRAGSLYPLLGMAGALVGAKIVDTLKVHILGADTLVVAVLGAVFLVIAWRQMQPP